MEPGGAALVGNNNQDKPVIFETFFFLDLF